MAFGEAKQDTFRRVPALPRRDGQGNLLPIKVYLYGAESKGEEIRMIPLTVGRINEIFVKQECEKIDFERIMFEECLVDPKLTWEEIQLLLPEYKYELFLTIAFENGFDVDQYTGAKKKKIEVPDEMKSDKRKLYEALKNDLGYARNCSGMHEMGYDFITVQRLCRRELSILADISREQSTKGSKGMGGNLKPPKKGMGRRK